MQLLLSCLQAEPGAKLSTYPRDTLSHRFSQLHRLPDVVLPLVVPTCRAHTAISTDSPVPSSPWADRDGRSHTHLQAHQDMSQGYWGMAQNQHSLPLHPAPLSSYPSYNPQLSIWSCLRFARGRTRLVWGRSSCLHASCWHTRCVHSPAPAGSHHCLPIRFVPLYVLASFSSCYPHLHWKGS